MIKDMIKEWLFPELSPSVEIIKSLKELKELDSESNRLLNNFKIDLNDFEKELDQYKIDHKEFDDSMAIYYIGQALHVVAHPDEGRERDHWGVLGSQKTFVYWKGLFEKIIANAEINSSLEYIKSEVFLDEIAERFKRKQL